MLLIRSWVAMKRAINGSIDPKLKALLVQRMAQLCIDDYDLGDIGAFLVIAPHDTAAAIEAALGFPILTNMVDGCRFGNPGFTPSWEWIEDHGDFFEIAFVLSDSGFGWIIIVPDQDHVDHSIIALCRAYRR